MGADAVAAQPAGIRQLERAREPAIIGEQQQALGVEVEPADADQPRQTFGQIVEHGRTALGVVMGRHQAARLVIEEQPRALALRQRLAVDGDDIIRGDVERRRIDHPAVDADAALRDHLLGVAARGEARTREHLGDTLAGLLRLDLFLAARPPLGITIALAIGAAAAEGRTLLEDPALIFVFARWTIGGTRFAAGMLVPVGTALGTLARTIEFRAIAAAIEPRTIIAWTIELGTIEFGPIEFGPLAERTVTRWTIVARTRKARTVVAAALPIVALLPGLVLTAVAAAEILARTLAEVLARRPVTARSRIALLPGF